MAWKHFDEWLVARNNQLELLLRLWEVSGEFPRGELNALFNSEIDRLIAQTTDPETKRNLRQAQGMDWIGYIDRAARNSGVMEHDLDHVVHDLVVRMLVKPGTLFSGWSGQPIQARFKLSVKNGLLNLRAARMTRRKRIPSMSIHGGEESAYDLPAPQPESETLIQAFREFLREKHGQAALDVFDERLEGGDVKELIGNGLTSYALKELVKRVKNAARDFAADDPGFLAMVEKAFRDEARTVGRRFAGKRN